MTEENIKKVLEAIEAALRACASEACCGTNADVASQGGQAVESCCGKEAAGPVIKIIGGKGAGCGCVCVVSTGTEA